jgi:dynein heavy chain 1
LGPGSQAYVEIVFGTEFLGEKHNALMHAIDKEIDAKIPVLLFGTKGYDASTAVQDIANEKGMRSRLKEISVGSSTAFKEADRAIDAAAKRGTWVMLKNVHLAPKQLDKLYKAVRQRPVHDNFRLFFSTEINDRLPQGLVLNARTFVYEPAVGVKVGVPLRSQHTMRCVRR